MIHVQDSVAYMNHTVVVTDCADADNNTMACRGIVCKCQHAQKSARQK